MYRAPIAFGQFLSGGVAALSLALGACSGGDAGTSAPTVAAPPPPATTAPPPPTPTAAPPPSAPTPAMASNTVATEQEASDFLAKATFGGSSADIAALVGRNKTDWLRTEFAKPETFMLPVLNARVNRGQSLSLTEHRPLYWENIIQSDDQLRQRMVFALSQILVVSDIAGNSNPRATAYYTDILARNAFGNYRDILQEVTYSPIMANWLTYLRNRKGDPRTGRMPDENYAREILQLFTIGLVELNMDGTLRRGPDGNPIETYNNDDVVGLARVFTGLFLESADTNGSTSFFSPLIINANEHSELEKSFLGETIPAGTGAAESIDRALDTIFNHPNLAPFVSRQLIQRFTSSNPSPEYIGRVAMAFETGNYTGPDGQRFGTGLRGDLEATLAAIMLDGSTEANSATSGKVREPILRFVHWARAFDIENIDADNERWLDNTSSPSDRLGQHPFRSPSVFNFYRPGYIAPGTETGAANLTAPELQLVNEATAIGYINFMERFVFDSSPQRDGNLDTFKATYAREAALADRPNELVDHLDTLLTGGRMSEETRGDIMSALEQLPLRGTNDSEDRLDRARLAILMAVTSPAFTILN